MIYGTAPFSTTSSPDFKIMRLFDAEYFRNSTKYRHSFSGILIGTYMHPTQGCHFEWSWVTWQNIQWHEVSHSLSATAELLVIKAVISTVLSPLMSTAACSTYTVINTKLMASTFTADLPPAPLKPRP